MEIKLLEVRDEGTTIPVICIQPVGRNAAEDWMLARSGYSSNRRSQSQYVIMAYLDGAEHFATCDPYDWENGRTLREAHNYIIDHWDELESGAVVDIEYILGETRAPKTSDRLKELVRR